MPVPGAVTNKETIQTELLTFESNDQTLFEAYLARPRQPGNYPGVIVLHGVAGLVEHFKDVARRLANAGFIALAPNLYSRVGTPNPADMPSVFAKAVMLADAQVVRDLEAAAGFLREQDGCNGKIGSLGFSAGGRYTLLLACSSDKLDAAIACWGGFLNRAGPQAETTPTRPVRVIDMANKLACPLLAVFGAEDPSPTPAEAEELRDRLEQTGKQATIKIFENAGHNFFLDVDPNSYREGPAHELWEMSLDFLRKHL